MIKTFRGQITDGGQIAIKLSTSNGLTGYTIKKFQVFPTTPGHTNSYESTVQVFSVERSGAIPTTGATVNFDDPTLLAVAYYQDHVDSAYPASVDIIFDNVTINQDIFVTHTSGTTAGVDENMNYYLELEQVKLDINQATVATLKDMRGRE